MLRGKVCARPSGDAQVGKRSCSATCKDCSLVLPACRESVCQAPTHRVIDATKHRQETRLGLFLRRGQGASQHRDESSFDHSHTQGVNHGRDGRKTNLWKGENPRISFRTHGNFMFPQRFRCVARVAQFCPLGIEVIPAHTITAAHLSPPSQHMNPLTTSQLRRSG